MDFDGRQWVYGFFLSDNVQERIYYLTIAGIGAIALIMALLLTKG